MEKFEYKIVPFLYSDLEELELMLNAMGRKGWELVEIKENYYIFKRNKNERDPHISDS